MGLLDVGLKKEDRELVVRLVTLLETVVILLNTKEVRVSLENKSVTDDIRKGK